MYNTRHHTKITVTYDFRDELCLIDWKKSDKAKDTIGATYDAPLQLASYIGALNSDPNYPFQV